MIEGFVVGDREVVARFDVMGPQFKKELRTGIERLSIKLQGNVKKDKLSGQVLGVRTGRGRRSVQQVIVEDGDKVAGIVSTAVPYMIGWETGWEGSSPSDSPSVSKFAVGSSAKFKNGSPKQRAFLVPALRELEGSGAIRKEIEAAAERATA